MVTRRVIYSFAESSRGRWMDGWGMYVHFLDKHEIFPSFEGHVFGGQDWVV